jgi:DnaJ-class molecular chaperone
MSSRCSSCWKYDTKKCDECRGFGKKDYGGFGIAQTCDRCGGSGEICNNCGKGTAK